jgi:hypothetical protein
VFSSPRRLPLVALIAAMLVVAGPARSNLLLNSGFETGDLSDWTTFTTTNGTIGTPTVIVFDTKGTGPSRSAEFVVGQVLASGSLPRGGGIVQSFAMPADDNLTISVDAASAGSAISGNVDGGVVRILLDGFTVVSHDFGAIAMNAVERVGLHITLPLTAGMHTVGVEMLRRFVTNDGSPRLYLDNIRALTDAQLLGAPGGWPAFAGLVAGLWWLRRKAAARQPSAV